MSNKKPLLLFLVLLLANLSRARVVDVRISDAEAWRVTEMYSYVGDTVHFLSPMYVVNNYYSGSFNVSPRLLYTPTNQCLPGTSEMRAYDSANSSSMATLNGVSGYHRVAERIDGLKVVITNVGRWTFLGADKWSCTRDDFLEPPVVDGDSVHRLLVCAWNLEYYLAINFGTGFGPNDAAEHARQRTKILSALRKINADIYGFMEIEQGQEALRELADSLGRNYVFINDGGTPYSSYIKVGYVYDSTKVEVVGQLQNNNFLYQHRKKMITFRECATGESFIFSLNHFKAKSGASGATGADSDQGDGQGIFNYSRTREAESVLTEYERYSKQIGETDILVMGDLNAYAKEDPITTFTNNGYADLHRAFHADSSYSYVFRGLAGYLDHALANKSMQRQVTGMSAWHINSCETDAYSYSNSNDLTMFRSSDHDPILVGLRLYDQNTYLNPVTINNASVLMEGDVPVVRDAIGGYYRLYNVSGVLINHGNLDVPRYELNALGSGFYIIDVFINGERNQFKLIVR